MPVSPLAMQIRFRNKYVKRPRRPQMPSQAHRGRAASAPSSSASTVRGVTREPLSASFSSIDTLASSSRSAKSLSPPSPRLGDTHVHLHVGQISVTTPMVPRPERPQTPPPSPVATTPPDPSTWMGWARINAEKLQPALGYVGAFIMFFVERIGFGINLNQLFARA